MHEFKVLHWRVEVKTFYISADIYCIHDTYYTVPKYVGSDKVCWLCCYVMCVFNEASTKCDSNLVWVQFLQSIINYNMYYVIFLSLGVLLIASSSTKKTEFVHDVLFDLWSCGLPILMATAFVHVSLLVGQCAIILTGDGFTCFRMDYRICKIFDWWCIAIFD